ncbi:MAG TPA: hypothetical protein VMK05_10000 [Burkholderiales bacterium]|nr:hypothetical protein [Burkholderiales bacterium]
MRSGPWVIALAIALIAAPALAQLRSLPQNAKRGNVDAVQYPLVQIAGITYRMAPGSTIRDDNNRIITPNFLPVGANVVFAFDMHGDIIQIVILTAQERERLNKTP